ncbi:MAG TPA: ParB/RepB/Spo0J family partition protein [Coxiellaceae bacterium]|nr:ParB/RepB/Spo0J family partition protein [Coxiellaceae bacterium]
MTKRGLGKGFGDMGLAELLSDSQRAPDQSTMQHVNVGQLQRGRYQPRREMSMEGLQDLANSIRAQGIIQPIVVRPMGEGYEIIAGERRWRAAQMAGLIEVPVVIRDIPDEAAIAMSLIENIQRQDLNPIEEAVALQRLITEFDMTHQGIAEAVGKSRTTVTNLLRLLNLVADVKNMVEKGQLEMGHARALVGLDEKRQWDVAQKIIIAGLSVRQTEQLIRDVNEEKRRVEETHDRSEKEPLDPDIQRLQNTLSEKLGAPIQFFHTASGKGKMVVHYNSLDELEGILAKIR